MRDETLLHMIRSIITRNYLIIEWNSVYMVLYLNGFCVISIVSIKIGRQRQKKKKRKNN